MTEYEKISARSKYAGAFYLPQMRQAACMGFACGRNAVPESEAHNCASEATQILRLNNEQNLRSLIGV